MSDAATKLAGAGGSAARCCPECGVDFKPGVKYCDFCGVKVVVDEAVPATPARRTHRSLAAGLLRGLVVVGFAVGILQYVGGRLKEQAAAPIPASSALEAKHLAAATCEVSVREQVRGPFRVIAFRSVLVAEEQVGYVVSGTVELQSAAGEQQRKKYFCRVHPDGNAGMTLDDARLY